MKNLPNILTLSRIVFAAIVSYLLLQHTLFGNALAALCFALAALTDLYDGYFARRMKLTSSFGKIMDPIADKVLMLAVFTTLAVLGIVATWMLIIIAVREIAVTVDRLMVMRNGQVLAAERAGKIKTALQMASVGIILLYLIAAQSIACAGWFVSIQQAWLAVIDILMIMTVILTISSGVSYFRTKCDLNSR